MIPPLLRENADFRRLWAGEAISLLGDQITTIALPLTAVLVLDAGPAQMGFLVAAGLAPNLLFALHAGAWVDRRGRRRQIMIAADLGRAALTASVPVVYWLGSLTLAQLYVVAFFIGTLSVLFSVSYQTLFVSVVPRDRYIQANSLLNGNRALSYVAGPSIGGFLVQLLSAAAALVVDALSFVGSALFLRRIKAAEPAPAEPDKGAVVAGARFILRSPIVRASLAATATINLFNFVFFSLFVLYATRSLDIRPGTLGLVLGAGAVGSVIGSLVTGRLARRVGVGPAFVLGCLLFPAPLLLVPLAGGPQPIVLALLFLAEFGSGFGVMILDISAGSIFAALIPDGMRARVSGAYLVVNYGVRPIGSLLGGFLGATIGLRPTLWIATVGGVLGVLWLLPSPVRSLRELPEPAG